MYENRNNVYKTESMRRIATVVTLRNERSKVSEIRCSYPVSLAINTSVLCIHDTNQYPIPIPLRAGSDPNIRRSDNSLRSRMCCYGNM